MHNNNKLQIGNDQHHHLPYVRTRVFHIHKCFVKTFFFQIYFIILSTKEHNRTLDQQQNK